MARQEQITKIQKEKHVEEGGGEQRKINRIAEKEAKKKVDEEEEAKRKENERLGEEWAADQVTMLFEPEPVEVVKKYQFPPFDERKKRAHQLNRGDEVATSSTAVPVFTGGVGVATDATRLVQPVEEASSSEGNDLIFPEQYRYDEADESEAQYHRDRVF